jgi:hypothetical protein
VFAAADPSVLTIGGPSRMRSMTRSRPRRRSWHYAFAALLVVLGVAAMHADVGVFTNASVSHEALAVASHSHDPEPLPGPADPAAPTDPCHAAGQACCVSALPTSAPRQWIALLVMVIAVVSGATQVPSLQRASMLGFGIGRRPPPPDLAALCVLRT